MIECYIHCLELIRHQYAKILIMNAKGGSGKTTVATNLAGYFAMKGESVAQGF